MYICICLCKRDFHNTFLFERISTTWNHEVDSSQERARQQYTWCNFINFVFIILLHDRFCSFAGISPIYKCMRMYIYIYVCTLYMYVHVYILDELDALLGQHNLSFSIDREVKRGSTSCSTTTATAQRIGLKATCIWVPFGLIRPRTGGATSSHPTKISKLNLVLNRHWPYTKKRNNLNSTRGPKMKSYTSWNTLIASLRTGVIYAKKTFYRLHMVSSYYIHLLGMVCGIILNIQNVWL